MAQLPVQAKQPTLSLVPQDQRTEAPRPFTSVLNILGAAALVCALTFLLYARHAWEVAIYLLVTDGLIALAWLSAASGIGAATLRAARIRFCSITLQFVVSAALGLGSTSLLILMLGLAGWMNRIVAIGIIIVGIGAFIWSIVVVVRQNRDVGLTRWAWLWLTIMPALGIALLCALAPPGVLWGDEPHGYDVVEYHLQVPREWFESGRITPLKHNVYSYFPLNVEMHYLLAMHIRGGPWAGMYLAQLMHVIFMALSVGAVYGILAELGLQYATLGAVAAASAPWVTLLAPVAYNEGGLLLLGTLAIGLMLLAMRSQSPLRIAMLAGAFAGFACGAKLTAAAMILLAVPIAALGALLPPPSVGANLVFALVPPANQAGRTRGSPLRREGTGGALSRLLLFIVMGIFTFSPWLIRNFIWSGNPVFPEATTLLSRGHFSEVQQQRWIRAHSPREDQRHLRSRIHAMWEQVWGQWRFGFVVLPLGVAAGIVSIEQRASRFLLLLLLIMSAIWLFFTHLQGRFLVLTIPIAGLLIGLVRQRAAATVLGAGVIVAAMLGLWLVHLQLRARDEVLQFIGVSQLTASTPLADHPVRPQDRVILIGDARAFLYGLPMSRLHYRTVFDVDAQSGQSSVEAWMSGIPVTPGSTLLLIDPNELRRFAATYWKIPPPDDIPQTVPFVVRR